MEKGKQNSLTDYQAKPRFNLFKLMRVVNKNKGKLFLIALLITYFVGVGTGSKITWVRAQGSHYIIQDIVNATDVYVDYLDSLSGGDIVSNAVLNMSQSEIQEMVFETGTSFPDSPVTGQPFYRTDLYEFYVYNGSDWESAGGAGEQGPQGEPGEGEPHIPYNYLITYNTTHYQARNGRTGAFDSNNTDLYTVFNYALSNLDTYGGSIYLDLDGNHTLSTGLTLAGNGVRGLGQKSILINGKGNKATVLNLASGITGMTFDSDLYLGLSDIGFYIASGSGRAFDCADARAVYGGYINNVRIENHGSSWAARLCPYNLFSYNLRIVSYGSGLILENPSTSESIGNSEFYMLSCVNYGDNSIALQLKSTDDMGLNLINFGFVMIQSSYDKSNTTGILIDGGTSGGYVSRCFFEQVSIEWEDTCLKLDNLAIENKIHCSYVMPNTGETFIHVAHANSYDNRFSATHVTPYAAGAFTFINDVTTTTTRPNIYEDIYTAGGTPSITITSALLRDVKGVSDYDVYELGTFGIATRRDSDDYGGAFSTYTPPQGYEGMIIIAEDTNGGSPGVRIYAYSGGSWNYVALS